MTATKINLIIVGVILALTAAFCQFFLFPGLTEWKELQNLTVEQAKTIKGQQLAVGDVGEIYASILDLDVRLADFDRRLPPRRQFGEFLQQVSDCLKESGVADYVVLPQAEQRLEAEELPESMSLVAGTTILSAKVTFDVEFFRVLTFLQRVRSLPRLTHVEALTMTSDERRPGCVKATIVLQTYCHSAVPEVPRESEGGI